MNKDPEAGLKERHLSSERVYDGSFIKLRVDTVLLPDGERAKREVVEHPGAVAILPLTDRKEIVMVRQYRHATGEVLLELPAGKREGEESPLACARRELEEETGLKASQWQILFSFYTSPGFCDEMIYLVVARGLSQGEAHPDSGEFIDTVTIPLDEAKRMIFSGEIKDAKTAIGILALEAVEEV